MAMSPKVMYKPVDALVSVVGGLIAGAVFKKLWHAVTHEVKAPDATQRDRQWKEILAAAALEGALFGLVKAGLARAGAKGFERATGAWPTD